MPTKCAFAGLRDGRRLSGAIDQFAAFNVSSYGHGSKSLQGTVVVKKTEAVGRDLPFFLGLSNTALLHNRVKQTGFAAGKETLRE